MNDKKRKRKGEEQPNGRDERGQKEEDRKRNRKADEGMRKDRRKERERWRGREGKKEKGRRGEERRGRGVEWREILGPVALNLSLQHTSQSRRRQMSAPDLCGMICLS